MKIRTARCFTGAIAVVAAALAFSCAGEPGDVAPVPDESATETESNGLDIHVREGLVEGTFERDEMVVEFSSRLTELGLGAAVTIDVDGIALEIVVDLSSQTMVEDAHDGVFAFEHREILLALRDAVDGQHPELRETLHGMLLIKAADRFAEVPIGRVMPRLDVALNAPHLFVSGCGGDGVSCLPGTHGSSWALFTVGSVCQAKATPYGDSVCRGRCGAGCNWFDEDYTWDCLDHDVCLDYSSDCGDEFNDAADDWVATLAPLCFSGTNRSAPPPEPMCGDGVVNVGEQCDDHGTAAGDGCSPSCAFEGHIVINEVDYDQPGTDGAEFVEIYNGTLGAVSLAGKALVLFNGATSQEYGRLVLSGTLASKGYLVVCPQGAASGTCGAGLAVPAGTLVINFSTATNVLQNGAPDAVALIDVMEGKLLDALSYEGSVSAGVTADAGAYDLVEGNQVAIHDDGVAAGAMVRLPNGKDSDDAAGDWSVRPPTPGSANQ